MRISLMALVAFATTLDAASVDEKASEVGCIAPPVWVEETMHKCVTYSGAWVYFNIAALPVPAGWLLIGGTAQGVFLYAEPTTLRKDGNFRRMWEFQSQKTRSTTAPYEGSTRSLWEHDCKELRSRVLDWTAFAGPMMTGSILQSKSGPSDWSYAAPGTVGEAALRFVCSR